LRGREEADGAPALSLPLNPTTIFLSLTSLSSRHSSPQVTDPYNERWRFDWITGAFWVALDFAFTAAVAVMFRPSAAATRFAYSDADGAAMAEAAQYEALEKGGGALGSAAGGRVSETGSAKIPAGKAAASGGGGGGDGSDEEAAKME